MVSMFNALASRGLRIETGWPLTRISPLSAGWAPDRTRIRVDLPAPLPPTRPMTSPACRSMVTSRTACTPPKATLMSRISTSGVPAATVTGRSSCRSRAAPTVEGVEADGHDQHDPGDDVLAGRVDAHEAQPVGERLQDEGAQDGARDGPDAAGERGPADDRRGDDVQLVALADVERRAVEPGRGDGGSEGAQDAH